jgi:Arc/MetJ-type ribon-helix-helix transcriptional regulator
VEKVSLVKLLEINDSPKRQMKLVTFHIPREMIRLLDNMVWEGFGANRSELIRLAVLNFLIESTDHKLIREIQ